MGAISRKKALRMPCRFKPPHFPFTQSRRLVGILGSIVQSFVLAMLHSRQDFPFRRTITGEFVGNDHARDVGEPFEQLTEKSFGCMLVTSALYQDIQHVAVLIHRPPQVVLLATNREYDLVQMPFVPTARTAVAQFIGVGLSKLQAPLMDGFIREDDTALGHQLFDISITEGETEIQPHTVADNFRRETEAFVIGSRVVCFHETILSHCSAISSS